MAKGIHIPPLAAHEGSWVVTRYDGTVVGEFFTRRNVERFNPLTCRVETIGAYLARVNGEIKAASGDSRQKATVDDGK